METVSKWKRCLTILLIIGVVSGSINNEFIFAAEISNKTPQIEERISNIPNCVTNEVIVKYKDESMADNSKVEGETVLTEDTSLIEADNIKELKATVEDLSKDSNVEYIQPNYVYQSLGITNDEYIDSQWALKNTGRLEQYNINSTPGIDINIENAWKMVSDTTKEVVVAVIDTGIDYKHPDLVNHIWKNKNEIPNNNIDDDKNGYVDDYYGWNFYDNNNATCQYGSSAYEKGEFRDDHGTHVAGIIAAESNNGIGVAGVAGNINTKIMTVQALGDGGFAKGTGTTASVTKGIEYAESMGATICNLSMGGNDSDAVMKSAIENSKMLFVIAAGNGDEQGKGYNVDDKPLYPASYDCDNIISVANLNYNGQLDESSCYGPKSIDIAAPGTYILSTWVYAPELRKYRFVTYSGTSMAAPMVTGVAALLQAYYDGITIKQTKKAILGSAKQLESLKDKVLSGGMLDAYQALNSNINTPEIRITQSPVRNSNNKKLTIMLSDRNNDIAQVRYAKGIRTEDYFEGGAKGTELETDNNSLVINSGGNYTVYVRDAEGNETVTTVNVTVLAVAKVKLSATSKTVKVKSSYVLKATLTPVGVYSAMKFTSSNSKVAAVSTKGKITAKKKGTATITVTASNGKKAVCRIMVK